MEKSNISRTVNRINWLYDVRWELNRLLKNKRECLRIRQKRKPTIFLTEVNRFVDEINRLVDIRNKVNIEIKELLKIFHVRIPFFQTEE